MSFESEFCVSYTQKRGRQKKAHTKNAFDLGCTTLKQSKRASQKKKKKKNVSVLIKRGRVSLSLSLSLLFLIHSLREERSEQFFPREEDFHRTNNHNNREKKEKKKRGQRRSTIGESLIGDDVGVLRVETRESFSI